MNQRMIRPPRLSGLMVLFAALLLGPGAHAAAFLWAVNDAPYRISVRPLDAPTSPEFGVEVRVPDFGLTRDDLSDVILLDLSGKPVPLAKVGRRAGGRIVFLAQKLDQSQYFLYFGGDKTRSSPEWVPKLSLMMETRPAPADLRFDSLQDLQFAWNRTNEAPGIGFVSQIYQAGNPFGPNTHFLSRYTGYLQFPKPKDITFYTLSSDCSFVSINDQLEFGWPGQHSPRATLGNVQEKLVHCPAGLVKVEYFAAKGGIAEGERLEAAMVLGWASGKSHGTIPPSAWMHAGSSQTGPIQCVTKKWLPVPVLNVVSFAGYGTQWLYEISFGINGDSNMHSSPVPCTATWEFDDGASISQTSGRRVLTGQQSHLIKCALNLSGTVINQVIRLDIPDKVQRASINDQNDIQHMISLMADETVSDPASFGSRLAFLVEFGTDQDVAKFVAKAPQKPKDDDFWISAQLSCIRILGQTDPAAARQQLASVGLSLTANQRPAFASQLAGAEMDLLVFCSRDPTAFGRLGQIGFLNPGDKISENLAQLAKVRIGDLYRLLGQYKEATAQYHLAGGGVNAAKTRLLPVKDTAESIAVRDLLDRGYIQNASAHLAQWEMRHPMAKFDSDFLLLRARALIAAGRATEALAELESYQKIQPDSPFQIDAQFYMGRILFEKGKKEEARKLWTSLAKDYPKHPLAAEAKTWAAKP